MDEFKTEKWTLDDGRRAERRVTEQNCEDGQIERVVELHVEDERPLRLQQRVVEKSKPIVYERKVETLDPNTGHVIQQRVESMEPKVQMQLVEHIASASSVAAQSVQDDHDCHVTKEEMIEAIVTAIKASRESAPVREVIRETVSETTTQPFKSQFMSNKNDDLSVRLNSLGLADEIAGRIDPNNSSIADKLLMGIIAAQIIGIIYILFFM